MTLEPLYRPTAPITAHNGRETARPRCPSTALDAHNTAPPPRVPLERHSSPSAPRATWPHGRAANRPAALPTPPSRRHPQAPESSLPSRRPRSTRVWRVPPTARAKHKAPKTESNERSETPPGNILRLLPTVAPEPAREGWCSLLSRRSRSASLQSIVHRSHSIQGVPGTRVKAALRKARL